MKEPVEKYRITSDYGYRILNGKRQHHSGVDFVSHINNKDVFSICDGECIFDFDNYEDSKRWLDPKDSAGNYVIIKSEIHKKDYYVRYLHLVRNYVSKGQKIKEGEKIGEYADVGYSFGAHLHLDIYDMSWIKIDPRPLLKSIIGDET